MQSRGAPVKGKVSLYCSCTDQQGLTTAVKGELEDDQACDSQLQSDLSNNQVTLLDRQQLSVDPTGNPGVGDESGSLRALGRVEFKCELWRGVSLFNFFFLDLVIRC